MKAFMDKDFVLETATAQHLFHEYAEKLPLVDYHCHLSPREIYEDRRFNDLVEVWLGGQLEDGSFAGDHYKWRLMRSNGVAEEYVTGNKPAYERFLKLVEALEDKLGVAVGEVTPDKKFTLDVARCIGACGLAPAVMVDNDVHRQVQPSGIDAMLKQY